MRALTLLAVFCLYSAGPLAGVSVLSHEEMVDIAWDSEIWPIIQSRFPGASAEEIKKARAFAYGGSVIQDVGYYPLGNQEFTNYLHYIRTGDFVAWMIREARTRNELAFALGALSHYAADIHGH
jgi:Zinc dependent phospholipase C